MDLRSGLVALVVALAGAEARAAGEEPGLLDRTAGNWSAAPPGQAGKAATEILPEAGPADGSVIAAVGLTPSDALPVAAAEGMPTLTPGEGRTPEVGLLPSIPLFPGFAGGIVAYGATEPTFSGQVSLGRGVLGVFDLGTRLAAPALDFGGLTLLTLGDQR